MSKIESFINSIDSVGIFGTLLVLLIVGIGAFMYYFYSTSESYTQQLYSIMSCDEWEQLSLNNTDKTFRNHYRENRIGDTL